MWTENRNLEGARQARAAISRAHLSATAIQPVNQRAMGLFGSDSPSKKEETAPLVTPEKEGLRQRRKSPFTKADEEKKDKIDQLVLAASDKVSPQVAEWLKKAAPAIRAISQAPPSPGALGRVGRADASISPAAAGHRNDRTILHHGGEEAVRDRQQAALGHSAGRHRPRPLLFRRRLLRLDCRRRGAARSRALGSLRPSLHRTPCFSHRYPRRPRRSR